MIKSKTSAFLLGMVLVYFGQAVRALWTDGPPPAAPAALGHITEADTTYTRIAPGDTLFFEAYDDAVIFYGKER